MPAENNRNIQIHSSKIMNSLFVWNFKASFAGKGIEFQDFREYHPDDDAKYIDWARSMQEGTTIMRRYREDKNAHILCFVDHRESLYFQDGVKIELFHRLTELLYNASRASQEAFWGYISSQEWVRYIVPCKTPVWLHACQDLSTSPSSVDSVLSLESLLSKNLKKSVIFVISDSMTLDEWSFKTAAKKHDIIFIHLSSYFEDTLQGEGLYSIYSGNLKRSIDLQDNKKKKLYQQKRKQQKEDFSYKLKWYGIDSMFLNERSSLFESFLTLMKTRSR